MKQNIKDRLNDYPRDFDQDALWDKIAAQKPKKKRRFFWLFPLLGFCIAALLVIIYWNSNELDNQTQFVNGSNKSEFEIEKQAITKNNRNISNASLGAASSVNDLDVVNEYHPNNNVGTEKISTSSSNEKANKNIQFKNQSEENSNTSFTGIRASSLVTQQMQSASTAKDQNILIKNTKPIFNENRSTPISNIEENSLNSQAMSHLTFDRNEIQSKDQNEGNISLLSNKTIDYLTLPQYKFPFIEVVPTINENELERSKTWAIGLSGGALWDSPKFNRAGLGNEKGKEGYSTSLFASKSLPNNIILSLESNYSKSFTHQFYEEESTNWVEGLQMPNLRTTRKKYDLYNDYARLDALLHIGYKVNIQSWQIIPKIGAGFNTWNAQSGHLINTSGDLELLEDYHLYKARTGVFYKASFDIQRSLQDYAIGLNFGIETRRNLEVFNENHTIRPIALKVYLAKSF